MDKTKAEKKLIRGVWIPLEVIFNPDLSYLNGVVFWIITQLDNEETHCYATNEYIASYLNVTTQSVSNSISKLKKYGYIKTVFNQRSARKRIIKIDQSYTQTYKYLVEDFNGKLYNKNYIGGIKKDITYNSINSKSLNKELKEEEWSIKDKRIQKAIEYWNSKGKPLPKHKIQNSKVIKRINSILGKRIRKNELTLKVIIQAIDVYYKFVTSSNVIKVTPVSMSQFLLFDNTYIVKVRKNVKEVDSWFEECLKGESYIFKKYGKFVKDHYPEVTEKIKSIWKAKELKISENIEDITYAENNFRIAAKKLVDFMAANEKRFTINRLQQKPILFISYLFEATLSKGNIEKIKPGSISNDYFYTQIFPNYLKQKRIMR